MTSGSQGSKLWAIIARERSPARSAPEQGPGAAFTPGQQQRGAESQTCSQILHIPCSRWLEALALPSFCCWWNGAARALSLQSSFKFVYWCWQKPIFTSVNRGDVAINEHSLPHYQRNCQLSTNFWTLWGWYTEHSSKTSGLFTFCYAGGEKKCGFNPWVDWVRDQGMYVYAGGSMAPWFHGTAFLIIIDLK